MTGKDFTFAGVHKIAQNATKGGHALNAAEWTTWLTEWAHEMSSKDDAFYEDLLRDSGIDPERILAKHYLNEPASEASITELELRLGLSLPPSYRAFLRASDGFAMPAAEIGPLRLFRSSEVGWLRDLDPETLAIWTADGAKNAIPDDVYFTYGPGAQSITMRSEYLHRTIVISTVEPGGTAVFLLNPAIVQAGEWEAWMFAHWLPGANRYRSFEDLLAATRADMA